jgi:hypothetical protein
MAAKSWDPLQPKIVAGPIEIIHGALEANSQTFKAGSPIYFNAGAVTLAAVGDVPVGGIALADATNVTSDNAVIPVMKIGADNVLQIQVTDGAAAKEASDTTCVPGVAYDFEIDSDGVFRIASDDVTNPKFVYQDPVYDSADASSYWGRFVIYGPEDQMRNK